MELVLFLTLLAGAHSLDITNKIINGDLARDGQFPHLVQISIKSSKGPPQYCGGSLLNSEWVLTVKIIHNDFS